MKLSRLLGVVALAGIGLVTTSSAAFAQNTIIGCANNTTGALRLVADASSCRDSESPVTLKTTGPQGPVGPAGPNGQPGPQGEPGAPGDDNVIAFGVSGQNITKTVFVTDLGTVTVSCQVFGSGVDGAANFFSSDGYQFREEITFAGSRQTLEGLSLGEVNRPFISPDMIIVNLLINKPGIGVWKVELRVSGKHTVNQTVFDCYSTAVITVMQ